jgi:hypothetical protein
LRREPDFVAEQTKSAVRIGDTDKLLNGSGCEIRRVPLPARDVLFPAGISRILAVAAQGLTFARMMD